MRGGRIGRLRLKHCYPLYAPGPFCAWPIINYNHHPLRFLPTDLLHPFGVRCSLTISLTRQAVNKESRKPRSATPSSPQWRLGVWVGGCRKKLIAFFLNHSAICFRYMGSCHLRTSGYPMSENLVATASSQQTASVGFLFILK